MKSFVGCISKGEKFIAVTNIMRWMFLSFTGGYICLFYINTKHIERRRERSKFYVFIKNVKTMRYVNWTGRYAVL